MYGRETPLVFENTSQTVLIWWIISDNFPKLMKMCEKMSAIVTDSSLLKASDVRLKNKSFWSKVCVRCELGIVEDAKHVVMQCPYYQNIRQEMLDEIEQLQCEGISDALRNAQDSFYILLAKQPANIAMENMIDLCLITRKHITRIYDNVIMR